MMLVLAVNASPVITVDEKQKTKTIVVNVIVEIEMLAIIVNADKE